MDWTVVLVALITGGVGWLSAREAAQGTIRGIEAENERLREQRDEANRSHRQAYYHQALNALERFDQMVTNVLPFRTGEFMPWLETFRGIVTGVSLFGRTDVGRAADDVYAAILKLESDALSEYGGAPFMPDHDLRGTHAELVQGFQGKRAVLLALMRDDVAPERALGPGETSVDPVDPG